MTDSESAVARHDQSVHCDRHGDRQKAFVCGHLLHGKNRGFFFDLNDRSNPHPDAWCAKCERARVDDGGEWSEASEALLDVRLVCGDCYEEIKAKNVVELQSL
jgi:hypothetical protein